MCVNKVSWFCLLVVTNLLMFSFWCHRPCSETVEKSRRVAPPLIVICFLRLFGLECRLVDNTLSIVCPKTTMAIDEATLDSKFTDVFNSQDSIQRLSLLLIHHRKHFAKIIESWKKILHKSKASHRLVLLYLANDVVQNAKKKKIMTFVEGFENALNSCISLFNDNLIRASVLRVLKIWKERGIYSSSTIREWQSSLQTSLSPPTNEASPQKESSMTSKIVAEYRLPVVLESLERMKQLERESASKRESIHEKSFSILNIDITSHLKDKRMGDVLLDQSAKDITLLEQLISSLEKETNYRKEFIEQLTKALIFYVVQNSEVDQVFKAYIKVGKNVAKVLKGMTEGPPRLEAPIDAPSPTNSDEGPILPSDKEVQSKTTSLDKRLQDILHGNVFGLMPSNGSGHQAHGTPGLDAMQPFYAASHSASTSTGNNGTSSHSNTPFVQPIRSVVSSRMESHPPAASMQENLEPSDMDLGNSDDEDNYASASTLSHIPYPRTAAPQTQEYNPSFPHYEAPIRSHPLPPQSQLYHASRDQRPSYHRHPVPPSASHATHAPPRRSSPEPFEPRRGRHQDWEPRSNSHALGRPRQGYKHEHESRRRGSSGSGPYHHH